MKVLFATDGSLGADAAAHVLSQFPWRAEDHLTVLTVSPWVDLLSQDGGTSAFAGYQDWNQKQADAAEETVRKAARPFADAFSQVETAVRTGPPVKEILDAADEVGADLIVVGRRGQSPFQEFVMGSVTRGLLENNRTSVLVGKYVADRTPSRVIVGYDGSEGSEEALQWVRRLPLPEGSEVGLVGVIESIPQPAASPTVLMPVEYTTASINVMEQQRKWMEERLDGACRLLEGTPLTVQPILRTGKAHAEILAAAEAFQAGLVILGSHADQGWMHRLLGNTPRALVQQAPCSVLIAHPKDPNRTAQEAEREEHPSVPAIV